MERLFKSQVRQIQNLYKFKALLYKNTRKSCPMFVNIFKNSPLSLFPYNHRSFHQTFDFLTFGVKVIFCKYYLSSIFTHRHTTIVLFINHTSVPFLIILLPVCYTIHVLMSIKCDELLIRSKNFTKIF